MLKLIPAHLKTITCSNQSLQNKAIVRIAFQMKLLMWIEHLNSSYHELFELCCNKTTESRESFLKKIKCGKGWAKNEMPIFAILAVNAGCYSHS